jgi:hypothetical protein
MSDVAVRPNIIELGLSEEFQGPALASYCQSDGGYSIVFLGSNKLGGEKLPLDAVHAAEALIKAGKHCRAWQKLCCGCA